MDPLLQILKRLKDQGVEFVLIGGMAAIAYGSGMVTTDVDISASLDDDSLEKIIKALRGLNPRWRDRPQQFIPVDSADRFRGCRNLYIETDWGKIDILSEVDGVGDHAQVRERSVEMTVGDLPCRVITLEALIAAKEAAGRDKDLANVKQLKAIKKSRGL
jgi:predicted nucleotidyltransferase